MRAPLVSRLAISTALLCLTGIAAAASYRYIGPMPSAEPTRATLPGADAGTQVTPQLRGAVQGVHNFYFTRAAYSSYGRSWDTDYPQADQWFATVLNRLSGIDTSPRENAVRLDDPQLRRFPFLYAVEVGRMALRPEEVEGLRSYLLAGGFLAVDDFWGTGEWRNFEREIRRVLPEHEIVEVPMDHPIFSTYYVIDEIVQVPNVGNGRRGGPTHERDGYVPHFRGIFDEAGRLMVAINWNTDLGDAWEWAELPDYPLEFSTYAYQMGANFIMYAMTH